MRLYRLTEEIKIKQRVYDILKEILYDGATMCLDDDGKTNFNENLTLLYNKLKNSYWPLLSNIPFSIRKFEN